MTETLGRETRLHHIPDISDCCLDDQMTRRLEHIPDNNRPITPRTIGAKSGAEPCTV